MWNSTSYLLFAPLQVVQWQLVLVSTTPCNTSSHPWPPGVWVRPAAWEPSCSLPERRASGTVSLTPGSWSISHMAMLRYVSGGWVWSGGVTLCLCTYIVCVCVCVGRVCDLWVWLHVCILPLCAWVQGQATDIAIQAKEIVEAESHSQQAVSWTHRTAFECDRYVHVYLRIHS